MANEGAWLGVANSKPTLDGGTIAGATISGGTINNTVIGGTTAVAGTFTTLTATGSAALLNASTDTLGFYGATVTTQPAAVDSVTTTGADSTTNAYGYTTAAQADAIVTSLNSVIAKLKTLGLMAT